MRGGAAVAPPRRSPLTKVPYLAGLDGLRALAVTAVVLYHAGVPWMEGGFLGVEVFFVISGYLITLLLLAEHDRSGRISLKDFWLRRARRLLPALYVLLVSVSVWCALFLRDELAELRGQLVAALAYITNWFLIATGQSYFDQLGRPPLLQHLWSLAVEEQFYLAWPVIMAVLLFFTRRRLGAMAVALAAMAAASTIWMAVLYDPGADPSRVYYGTDTRAAGLVLGALLALFWRPAALARGPVAGKGATLDVIGLGGLAVLGLLVTRASETGPFLYYGGFLLCGLASLGVIAAAAHPRSVLAQVLGLQPLRYLGTRSYGIYLWHWPIFMLTRPGVDVDWSTTRVWLVRIGLTLALTEVSYRLVEAPIRAGGLGAWMRSLRGPATLRRDGRRRLTVGVVGASLSVMVPVGAVIATASTYDPIADSLRQGQQAVGTVAALGTGGALAPVRDHRAHPTRLPRGQHRPAHVGPRRGPRDHRRPPPRSTAWSPHPRPRPPSPRRRRPPPPRRPPPRPLATRWWPSATP
jgi:peptidoglycan/LPS O-acetylase OafA/YrhL